MATDKAALEVRVRTLEGVLDLVHRDEEDEDAPINCLANDLEVLRHKTIEEINAQTKVRDYPLPEAVENGSFDEYAQNVWDGMTEVGVDFESVVTLAGNKPNHAMDQRRAIFLGKLAELEIAFGEYMGEVHNQ
jgi:seryl-tRNA synthetase